MEIKKPNLYEEDKLYRIDLTETQLRLIASVLDSASRAICGQLTSQYNFPLQEAIRKKYPKFEEYMDVKDSVDSLMENVKKTIFPDQNVNSHNGIGYDETSDLLYEMYKCIMYKLVKDDTSISSVNVHKRPPLELTDEPFINVKELTRDILREEDINNILDDGK